MVLGVTYMDNSMDSKSNDVEATRLYQDWSKIMVKRCYVQKEIDVKFSGGN